MTTSRAQRSLPEAGEDAAPTHLERENAQLRQAVDSHATVDQAIGVLVAVHRLAPTTGFEVLREVSQHANVKLHAVAETVIEWALGGPLPSPVGRELDAAVQRCLSVEGGPGRPEEAHGGP
ncbi:ANTAR domain-containing protein [Streptomyces sp. NPDC015242]|uniref:ANTAR domain-containing protein n=1 Tax=Streptomyces sp. NPDC015242 TaxID=3364951 RepID=UPI0036FCB972